MKTGKSFQFSLYFLFHFRRTKFSVFFAGRLGERSKSIHCIVLSRNESIKYFPALFGRTGINGLFRTAWLQFKRDTNNVHCSFSLYFRELRQ